MFDSKARRGIWIENVFWNKERRNINESKKKVWHNVYKICKQFCEDNGIDFERTKILWKSRIWDISTVKLHLKTVKIFHSSSQQNIKSNNFIYKTDIIFNLCTILSVKIQSLLLKN